MPPLGPTSQRAAVRARAPQRRKREANLARIPKARPAGAPNFPTAVYRPGQIVRPKAPRPTPAQLRASRIQERQYASQAGAVRRAAKTQKTLGPGKAVRPAHGPVLRKRDIKAEQVRQRALAQEREYKSQGESVKKQAERQLVQREAKRKVKIGGLEIDAARLSKDPAVQKAGGLKGPGKLEAAISAPKYAVKYGLTPAVKDVKDIVIGTPTSLVKLGVEQGKAVKESVEKGSVKPLIKTEKETAKALAEPYIEAVKHPVKAITEHPVSTALMFAPTVKVPLRGVGRVARITGKTPVFHEATLPGTTLKSLHPEPSEIIPAGVEAAKRAVHGKPGPTVTTQHKIGQTPELDRRVDENYDAGQQHQQHVRVKKTKQAREQHKNLPKRQRREQIQTDVQGAVAGARQEADRHFAREFGSHREVSNNGLVYEPKNAPEMGGKLHTNEADAKKVAESLRKDPKITWEPHVMKVEHVQGGDGYAVVPKQAHDRYTWHKQVGTSPALGAVNRRVLIKQFKKAVLPFSRMFLPTQASEAAVRNLMHGSGPTSYIRARRVLSRMPEKERRELLARTVQPAHFGATGPSGEFARGGGRTLKEEYAKTPEAQPYVDLATKAGKPLAPLRALHRGWSHLMFNEINGRIEQLSKTAILGKEMKRHMQGPRRQGETRGQFLERNLLGLSDKAMHEAAQGHTNTSVQVELGRQLNRAYGKYSQMSPKAREQIIHQTPFIPWFRNMVQFNLSVMPKDHPIKTSLIAAYDQTTEDWRKKQQLSYHGGKDERVPDWLMGSYPAFGGKVPVGRFGPFVPGEYLGTTAGQFSPMFQGMLMNLAGTDWTGTELKGASQEKLGALAALTAAETFLPGFSQAERLTGYGERVRGKKAPGGGKTPTIGKGKRIDKALLDMVNPLKPIKGKDAGGGKGGGPKVPDIKIRDLKIPDIKDLR